MGLRRISISHNFFTYNWPQRHLEYIEMLNDARVTSLRFFKDIVCTTRINKEKKCKIKFQVLLNFAQILPDYTSQSQNFYFFTSDLENLKRYCEINLSITKTHNQDSLTDMP